MGFQTHLDKAAVNMGSHSTHAHTNIQMCDGAQIKVTDAYLLLI